MTNPRKGADVLKVQAGILVDFEQCARCAESGIKHDAPLLFQPFAMWPIEDVDGTIWTHWALCPVTGEPVLLKEAE